MERGWRLGRSRAAGSSLGAWLEGITAPAPRPPPQLELALEPGQIRNTFWLQNTGVWNLLCDLHKSPCFPEAHFCNPGNKIISSSVEVLTEWHCP